MRREAMRIGISAHFFKYPATGLGQYLVHLSNKLVEIDQKNEYFLFGSGPSAPNNFQHPQRCMTYPAPSWSRRNANVEQAVWEQWTIPLAARQARINLLHYPYFAAPLRSPAPTIVTIADA